MNPIKSLLLQFPLYWIRCWSEPTLSAHLSVCWFMCVCVHTDGSLFVCEHVYFKADNECAACILWFQSKAAWLARQRAPVCNHKHNAHRSLDLFPQPNQSGGCLSLIHSMIGYLFPIILIQTMCPWESWSNSAALISIHSPVVWVCFLQCILFSFLYRDCWPSWVN